MKPQSSLCSSKAVHILVVVGNRRVENLSTSTELQGFHYFQEKYNSAQEYSQETQIPIHPNSPSPTRQENTILSSYAVARLLGIISITNSLLLATYHKAHIYTCYFIKSALGIPNTTCIRAISMTRLAWLGLMGLWQNSSHTSRHINTLFIGTKRLQKSYVSS